LKGLRGGYFVAHVLPFSILFGIVLSTTGCTGAERGQLMVKPVPVKTIALPDSLSFGSPLVVRVTCLTENPCWRYHGIQESRTDSVVNITVFAAYDDRPCIQILSSFDTTLTLSPGRIGVYRLRFWTDSTRTLAASVVVVP
jgi:hypothetical protein